MSTANTLSLSIVNNSQKAGSFILFQVYPNMDQFRMLPVVWKSIQLPTGSTGRFEWRTSFLFVAGTGDVRPGGRFSQQTSADADPKGNNVNTLSGGKGFMSFGRPERGGRPDTLTLKTESSLPMNGITAGIGMEEAAVIVGPVMPNYNVNYDTSPQYRVAFGNFQQGEMLNPTIQSVVVDFSRGSSMKAEYNADGSWTVNQG